MFVSVFSGRIPATFSLRGHALGELPLQQGFLSDQSVVAQSAVGSQLSQQDSRGHALGDLPLQQGFLFSRRCPIRGRVDAVQFIGLDATCSLCTFEDKHAENKHEIKASRTI